MSRGDERDRAPDRDTQRGVGSAMRRIYPPEQAADQQFDDLIAKLGKVPATGRGAGKPTTH